MPASGEWATLSIPGSAGSIFTEAALDAAVQTNGASSFSNALVLDSAHIPTPHTLASWSSTRRAVYTGPAGVAAEMLMATLRNDTGESLFSFQIAYDFDVIPTTSSTPEELPGQRVYFSLTGLPHSWQFIPELYAGTNVGPRHAVLNVGAWPANTLLYILWVQDNASHSPDSCYLIDNFVVGGEPPPPPCILTQPTNTIVMEGQSATFSVTTCGVPPSYFQWFKNGAPILGATQGTLLIPRAQLTDMGVYFVVLSNSASSDSSRMASLLVLPDQEPPRAVLAYLVEDTNSWLDTISVFFSERVETNSAGAIGNYSLRSVSPGSPATIIDVSVRNETNVVLHVEKLTPGVSYFLSVADVTDQSAAHHALSPNPTTLALQTFGPPVISDDHPWKYLEAPTNTTRSGWMNPEFDDSLWPTGPGAFGLPFDEVIPPPFVFRTVIRTPDAGGPITTYFRTWFSLPDSNTNAVVQLSGVFDEGAVVYLNGTEVWRVRLPNGPVTTSTLASNAVEPHVLDGPRDFCAAGVLRPGTNWLAVELHQVTAFSGDAVMGLIMRLSQATGCIPALAISQSGNNTISMSWTCAGTLQVSPTLGGPPESWHDVVTTTNSFSTNLTAGALFFRVRL